MLTHLKKWQNHYILIIDNILMKIVFSKTIKTVVKNVTMFFTFANLFNVWPNRIPRDSHNWIQPTAAPHGMQCLESPTAHCAEEESEKGKWCFGITVINAFLPCQLPERNPDNPRDPLVTL